MWNCDWSSDVCSSDLHKDVVRNGRDQQRHNKLEIAGWLMLRFDWHRLTQDAAGVLKEVCDAVRARQLLVKVPASPSSEERRVGKECRSRLSTYHVSKY